MMNPVPFFSLIALALGLVVLPSLPVQAEEDGERFPPIKHEATLKECAACHMAFQPQMLPKRSWEALMGNLPIRFGEASSLALELQPPTPPFPPANAADARGKSRWMRRIAASETPLRITETPQWKREHEGEVRPERFTDPKVKSKANCLACHKSADKGYYEDD